MSQNRAARPFLLEKSHLGQKTMKRPVDWLNYQHLLYFWMVSKNDTLGEAARKLHLTSPTVSAQIRKLEKKIGHQLMVQRGRRLELTDVGRTVQQYAEQIFGLGSELAEVLDGKTPGGEIRLRVGVVDAVPKLVVHRLLLPVLDMQVQVRLACSEGPEWDLIDQLASHQLDVVLADTAGSVTQERPVFHHLLGESGVSFFAADHLAEQLPRVLIERGNLRELLQRTAVLLPAANSALRRQLDTYFEREQIEPSIAHEFADTALMKVFGEAGLGIFPAPTAIEEPICQQYRVRRVGQIEEIRDAFYAVTAERQIRHPAVELLTRAGRRLWADANAIDE
jgi:LysR family transcriptional activator of nhaA